MAASLIAARCREARGILFRILVAGLNGMVLSGVASEVDKVVGATAGERGGKKMGPAGRLPEPEQQLLVGPWGQIRPALVT